MPFYNRSAIPVVIGIYGLAFGGFSLWGMPSLMLPDDAGSGTVVEQPASATGTVMVPEIRQNPLSATESGEVLASGTVIPAAPRASVAELPASEVPDAVSPAAESQGIVASGKSTATTSPSFPGAIVATEVDTPAVPEPVASRPTEPDISPELSPVARENGSRRPRAGRELVEAVETGDLVRARKLVASGGSVRSVTATGESLLMRASWHGRESMVRWLLSEGANPNFQSAKGLSALINAAIRGHKGVVEVLLAEDARVNHASRDGRTGLMAAAWNGHADLVRLLVRRGADVSARDRLGRTALHYAAASGQERSASILLASGASPSLPDESGRSSLDLARDNGFELGGVTR